MKSGSIIYLPHGGGPLPLLGDPGHAQMVDFLKSVPGNWKKPDGILVVSAHWEESISTVISGPNPAMLYDYYGFPPESYEIEYPAPGNPPMAATILDLLGKAGIDARAEEERGFDHGVFVPLMLMYPEADIPCLQLSLLRGLDPESHIRVGEALSGLLDQNILVIGSGLSYHNLAEFGRGGAGADEANREFHDWLIDICRSEYVEPKERRRHLVHWESAPNARYCHPREEHLIPLHVCLGMAGCKAAKLLFDGPVLGRRAAAFGW